jgi:catechol 2,3-dioxygenase-like lactoylglutathione lyase family enzyme
MSAPGAASGSERAQPESFRARALNVSLTVKDLAASTGWYRDVVGFTVERTYEREGRTVGTALVAGDVRMLLNQDNGARGLDRVKGEGFSMQIVTTQSIDGAHPREGRHAGERTGGHALGRPHLSTHRSRRLPDRHLVGASGRRLTDH